MKIILLNRVVMLLYLKKRVIDKKIVVKTFLFPENSQLPCTGKQKGSKNQIYDFAKELRCS